MSEILLNAYSNTKADVFFANIKEKEYLELKLCGGKAKFKFFQKVDFDMWENLPPNEIYFPTNSDTNIVFVSPIVLKRLSSKNLQKQDSTVISFGLKESLDSFWTKDKTTKASQFIQQESRIYAGVGSGSLIEYTSLGDSSFIPYYLRYFVGEIENVKSVAKIQIGDRTEGVIYFRKSKELPFAEGLRYFISQRQEYMPNPKNK
jgi:hypothetical protein